MSISCCLIGEDNVLLHCGNLLLEKAHAIKLVVSKTCSIIDWAQSNAIKVVPSIQDLLKEDFSDIDYIFSIVNSQILPSEIIRLPQKAVINYHDSKLPSYAGLFSTTWALINDEKEHGVTWHVVNEQVDEGDILCQKTIPIFKDDTALSLNLRCFEAATESFSDLIVQLEQNHHLVIKQDLSQRSYYGKNTQLQNFGFIDWSKCSAQFIERLCRALDFGAYENHVGTVKLLLENDYVIIPKVEILNQQKSLFLPGTVIDVQKNHLRIATLTDDIIIKHVLTNQGDELSIDALTQKYQISNHCQFKSINFENDSIISNKIKESRSQEKKLLAQLVDIDEHAIFYHHNLNQHDGVDAEFSIDLKHFDFLKNSIAEIDETHILTTLLIYLYRLNNYEHINISLVDNEYEHLIQGSHGFLSGLSIVSAKWKDDMSLYDAYSKTCEAIQTHCHLTDIISRYPELKDNIILPAVLIHFNQTPIANIPDHVQLYVQFDKLNKKINIKCLNGIYQSNVPLFINSPEHITSILNHLMRHHEKAINRISFLASSEKKNLLSQLGQGEHRPIPHGTITERFEQHVKIEPNATAILFNNEVITYLELWKISEKVYCEILKHNMDIQSAIGIYMSRSPEMIGTILGVLKAGHIYVPMDIKYPMLKIESMVSGASVEMIISTQSSKKQLNNHFSHHFSVNILELEALDPPLKKASYNKHSAANSTKNLAYIMFTSGTTGSPKGVEITQANILNYCHWFTETTHFKNNSRIDFSSSIAFDLSVPCTIAPLLVGGSIAICTDADKTNPKRYLNHLYEKKVTHVELTPGYVEMLLGYPELIKKLIDLEVMLLGADVVHEAEVTQWLKLCPKHQIVNEYGPTEATVSATSYFVKKDELSGKHSVPIGKPGFNTTAYILDKYNNLCPVGMKGELCIGGEQVAKGYHGKPELTAKKFISIDAINEHEVVYKTGDLVSWLEDGNLRFFGRDDNQVKLHGYRIELPGIESVLLKIPEIHHAAVMIKEGPNKEKFLRAYLVSSHKDLNINDIKQFLLSYLPAYMVPKEFFLTPSIPLKENEKIDLKKLDKQDSHQLKFDHELKPHLSTSEEMIMRIWQNEFHRANLDVHDDFFDIGGNSLMALQIISELKKHYGVDVPLSFLFEYPTIHAFATQIESLAYQNKSAETVRKTPSSIVALAKGSHPIPLFLVHPVGGSVFWYKHLAKLFEGSLTIYGIQDTTIDGEDITFNTLESMASYYLHAIQEVYTGSEFYLGGASFGATVAFEMANQLNNTGHQVPFLGLFDGWAEYPADIMEEPSTVYLSQEQQVNHEKKHMLAELENYRKNLLLHYKIPVLQTSATLFKAKELWDAFMPYNDKENGWTPYINGKLTTHHVPGDHETMFFNSNVFVLGNTLAKALDIDMALKDDGKL